MVFPWRGEIPGSCPDAVRYHALFRDQRKLFFFASRKNANLKQINVQGKKTNKKTEILTLPLKSYRYSYSLLWKKVTVTVTRYFFGMSNEYALRYGVTFYPLLADFLDSSFTRSLRENYASSEQKKETFWGCQCIT